MPSSIRSYRLDLSRSATLELLRALGVRDRPLPRRFRRALVNDPTLYMEVRDQGVLLWQHPLSGREAQILPLSIVELDHGVRVEVLRARMRRTTLLLLGASFVAAPLLVWASPIALVPLVGGTACGLWLHYRDHRPIGLECMIDDNLRLLDREASAAVEVAGPSGLEIVSDVWRDLVSTPMPVEQP
jgi:hypothetical protein